MVIYYAGYGSTDFTLNLGSKFNTSKVTNMSNMFRLCGATDPDFVLDVSQFTVSSSCTITDFAINGIKTIKFGEGWSNATLVDSMFTYGFSNPVTLINAPSNIQEYFVSDYITYVTE